jgi:hypothetical protein
VPRNIHMAVSVLDWAMVHGSWWTHACGCIDRRRSSPWVAPTSPPLLAHQAPSPPHHSSSYSSLLQLTRWQFGQWRAPLFTLSRGLAALLRGSTAPWARDELTEGLKATAWRSYGAVRDSCGLTTVAGLGVAPTAAFRAEVAPFLRLGSQGKRES